VVSGVHDSHCTGPAWDCLREAYGTLALGVAESPRFERSRAEREGGGRREGEGGRGARGRGEGPFVSSSLTAMPSSTSSGSRHPIERFGGGTWHLNRDPEAHVHSARCSCCARAKIQQHDLGAVLYTGHRHTISISTAAAATATVIIRVSYAWYFDCLGRPFLCKEASPLPLACSNRAAR
jgi:hypothetical protein